jgi:hypothetical protein
LEKLEFHDVFTLPKVIPRNARGVAPDSPLADLLNRKEACRQRQERRIGSKKMRNWHGGGI